MGSRVWRRAVKRAGHSRYWQRMSFLHEDSYRSSKGKEIYLGHVIDTHALLLTEVGQIASAVVGAIWPLLGAVLALITVALQDEEKELLAAELALQMTQACIDNPLEKCVDTEEALWYAEYIYGTTMTPGGQTVITQQAVDILNKYLEDGGDAGKVREYLGEIDKARSLTRFDEYVKSQNG